jgi:hypothetical protein
MTAASVYAKPMAAAPVDSVAAPAVALHSLRLTSPWLDLHHWEARGVDQRQRPVSARGTVRGDAAAASAGVRLPAGFSGRVVLRSSRGQPLGQLQLRAVGTPAFDVRSADLAVRKLSADELLVDPRSTPTRCYVTLPAALNAASAVVRHPDGQRQQFAPASPRGFSLNLPPRFGGLVDLLDAQGRLLAQFCFSRSGDAGGVQAKLPPGLSAQCQSRAGLISIAVQPASLKWRAPR